MRSVSNIVRKFGRTVRAAICRYTPLTDGTVYEAAEPAEQRLRRLAQWCVTGRQAEVELELHQWRREDNCPTGVCVMLAALLSRRGRFDHALKTLHELQPHELEEDPSLLQEWIAVLTEVDLTDAARRMSQQLHQIHGHDPRVVRWLQAMSVPGVEQLPAISEATIEQLAAELIASPIAIASLVAAQKLSTDVHSVQMLRRAISRAARDLTESDTQLMVCQAMADLALMADDQDDARRWAHRGLKIEPYAASLALVLARVSDDEAVGPPAIKVLSLAVDNNPSYPDLKAALIRRASADGRVHEAQMRLAGWLNNEPDHPIAQQLKEELRLVA